LLLVVPWLLDIIDKKILIKKTRAFFGLKSLFWCQKSDLSALVIGGLTRSSFSVILP
jgi:hypothetical protein